MNDIQRKQNPPHNGNCPFENHLTNINITYKHERTKTRTFIITDIYIYISVYIYVIVYKGPSEITVIFTVLTEWKCVLFCAGWKIRGHNFRHTAIQLNYGAAISVP
jgi:hypothetical protein